MKISEILKRKRGQGLPILSCEFSPPKTPAGEEALYRTIDDLRPLGPDFVSVTYGAGGSTREKTLEWVDRIKHEHGVETMAHLTCVGATRDAISDILDELAAHGIDNIMALRGDPPADQPEFRAVAGGFGHANELVAFIRERHGERFSLGVAGYPETHPQASSPDADLAYLAAKVRAGADFVVTQLFFDNGYYLDFVERFHRANPDLATPIIPGIMPITAARQIDKVAGLTGSHMPAALRARFTAAADDAAVAAIGTAHALEQARVLLGAGAPGIHFYTFNKSPATRRIMESLRHVETE